MNTGSLTIHHLRDLSNQYGVPFFEFEISSAAHFNTKLASIMLEEERRYLEIEEQFLRERKLKESPIDANDPEWWQGYSIEDRFKMHKYQDFLSFPIPEILALRKVVFECRDRYLTFLGGYQGKRPNYFHAWPVFSKKKRLPENPHVHHFSPLNMAAVYYVGGAFAPGNGELDIYPNYKDRSHKLSYRPITGRLIFFPANLPHAVGQYDGTITRFSIGMDLWFSKEDWKNGKLRTE